MQIFIYFLICVTKDIIDIRICDEDNLVNLSLELTHITEKLTVGVFAHFQYIKEDIAQIDR